METGGHSGRFGAQLAPGQRAIKVLDGGPIRGAIGVVQHRTDHAEIHHFLHQVLHNSAPLI